VHLSRLKLMNFQSFGAAPTTLELGDLTFLLGPNGAGKTAVLTALARMFAIDPGLRRIQRSDFHVPPSGLTADQLENQTLWIEADFVSDQPEEDGTSSSTIPSFFNHMRISAPDELPRVRVRLTASTDDVGDVEEKIVFVTEVDGHDEPIASASMDRYDRRAIQVHYLPAGRFRFTTYPPGVIPGVTSLTRATHCSGACYAPLTGAPRNL
jgi:putative ATP-dependent endonuclease of the OLD family